MNRRTALKQVLIISAGAALLPSCSEDKASFPLKNLTLSGPDEKLMAALSDSIIPASNNFYGAAEVKAHEFTLMMVDDCETPEVQKEFTSGLQAFSKKINEEYKNSFDRLKPEQKNEILSKLETKTFGDEDIQHFYSMTKSYTLLAYTSSPKYMKEVRKYKMVPGSSFIGCIEKEVGS